MSIQNNLHCKVTIVNKLTRGPANGGLREIFYLFTYVRDGQLDMLYKNHSDPLKDVATANFPLLTPNFRLFAHILPSTKFVQSPEIIQIRWKMLLQQSSPFGPHFPLWKKALNLDFCVKEYVCQVSPRSLENSASRPTDVWQSCSTASVCT